MAETQQTYEGEKKVMSAISSNIRFLKKAVREEELEEYDKDVSNLGHLSMF